MARVVVDPIPRIEGHLRIEVEIEKGKVKDAWSTGTLFRGLEIILQGRDPRDAHLITQRSCGVCTLVHSLAGVRAVEDALKIQIPPTARIVRNLTHAAQNMHDHPTHFYQLCALDWVDVVSALKADTKKTAEFSEKHSGRPQAKEYYDGLKGKLKAFVDSGQLGPFANAYWGHPDYKLPPEANLMAVGHYLDNLRRQVYAAQMTAIWGAKNPHLQGHLPGGVTVAEQLDIEHISKISTCCGSRSSSSKTFISPTSWPLPRPTSTGQRSAATRTTSLTVTSLKEKRNPIPSTSNAARFSTAN